MRLIEFRILMPFTIDEFYIGQSWSFLEISRYNTSGGVGVEIIKNHPFEMPAHNPNDICSYLPEYDPIHITKSKSKKSKKTHSSKRFTALKHFLLGSDAHSPDEQHEDDNLHKDTKLCQAQTGRYTYKQYRLYSMLPWYVQKVWRHFCNKKIVFP